MRGFRLDRPLLFSAKAVFESHFGERAILRGLADRTLISGELAVSHHNNSKARVVLDSKEKVTCNGFISRNRALSGDRVYARFVEESPASTGDESSLCDVQSLEQVVEVAVSDKSCRVVGIQQRSGMRYLARARVGDPLVQPRDPRFPAMRPVPELTVDVPSLAVVKFKDWETTQQYPDCDVVRILGKEGSFNAEDDASLEMNGLVSDPYPGHIEEALVQQFPNAEALISREISRRKDFRSERVFSIDPPSAKDLDDAVSVSHLPDGTFKIGVHVADVCFFVPPGSELDMEARLRATSVYLPRRVYPMLPAYLSENLCSLLPGSDRLAFSVFFVLSETGEVVGDPEFVRSVIHSRVKLSYDQVDSNQVPPEVQSDISTLMRLTKKLRSQRISNGSVSLDDRNSQEIKFEFADLPNGDTFPVQVVNEVSVRQSGGHDSHTLIEELMVLTNKLIADKLCESGTLTTPVLRRHMGTEDAVVEAGSGFLSKVGVAVNPDLTLQDILTLARQNLTPSQLSTFTHSILGEFSRAEYIVGSESASAAHWGVGTARYMHFTSPIRRYADLIVHRKLCRIIGSTDACDDDEEEASVLAQIKTCNANSKASQEAEKDNKLYYFSTLVSSFGNRGFQTEAIVKQLIAPDPERGVKGSVEFFLPIIGDSRSQSLDSLGLEIVDLEKSGPDVTACRVKSKFGDEQALNLLQPVRVRAYVKNPNAAVPKFHLRLDKVPLPPPTRKRPRNGLT